MLTTEKLNNHVLSAVRTLTVEMRSEGGKPVDSLVALECVMLGVIMFNEQAFGVPRALSVEQVELLIQRFYERLSDPARQSTKR